MSKYHSMFSKSYIRKIYRNIALLLAIFIVGTVPAFAEGPKLPSSMSNDFAVLMVIIICALALIIFMMGRLVIGAAYLYIEKEKKATEVAAETGEKKEIEQKKEKIRVSPAAAIFTIIFLLLSVQIFAQDKAVAATSSGDHSGLSPTAYYLLVSVVAVELLLIAVLLYMLKVFAGIKRKQKTSVTAQGFVFVPRVSWWDRFNKLKPIEQEANIDLGHDYDGIRELDNKLPPWWLYGFYCTIVFAFIYFYMHEISHSEPNGVEEYQIAVAKAEVDKAAYLKKAANNVDETTVKLLTDETSLIAGKQVFQTTCFACHGKLGEGGVGPNLTDDYWLHGGSINDVFKTIKYGWQDKGMKSWKDDYSAIQIAQIASYVKSLHGTKPPNAKAPQGALYTGAASANEPPKKDSIIARKS